MELFCRELGEGHPLIIMHGLFGSSDNWLTQAKKLSEDYKVYLIDARNHGQSPHDSAHNYTVISQDIMEFIKKHKLVNPYMIGHSMGGKALMKFLCLYPDIIKKAIVADISPRFYPRHHEHIIDGLSAITLNTLSSRQEADDILAAYLPNLGERQFLLKNLYRNENGNFQWRMNLDVLVQEIDNIGEGLDSNCRVYTPTLFINGGASDYVKVEDQTLISALFSKSSFITISGAGHWLHAEKPEEFLNHVKQFLH